METQQTHLEEFPSISFIQIQSFRLTSISLDRWSGTRRTDLGVRAMWTFSSRTCTTGLTLDYHYERAWPHTIVIVQSRPFQGFFDAIDGTRYQTTLLIQRRQSHQHNKISKNVPCRYPLFSISTFLNFSLQKGGCRGPSEGLRDAEALSVRVQTVQEPFRVGKICRYGKDVDQKLQSIELL